MPFHEASRRYRWPALSPRALHRRHDAFSPLPGWEPVTEYGVECPACLGGELDSYTDDALRGPGSPIACGRCDGESYVRPRCAVCGDEASEGDVMIADYDAMAVRCLGCARRGQR